ncbi:MAG TPA: hypothetical protein VGI39_31760 [Polyangiaceae bacterium]
MRSTRRQKLTHAELQELFRNDDPPEGRLTPVVDPHLVQGALDGARTSVPSRPPRSTRVLVHPLPSRARTALAVAAGCTISAAALFAYLVTPANAVRPPPVAAAPIPPGQRPPHRALPPLPSSISATPASAVAPPRTTPSGPTARAPEPEPSPLPAPSHSSDTSTSGKPPPPADLTDKL